jgi:hypothetical protein
MENLRKKSETGIKNKMEGHSSRIEQTQGIISEPEDEMVTKGKTEKLVVKQLKTYENKMQKLTDSIKDQTSESWTLKKEKRCKQKECVIYSTK